MFNKSFFDLEKFKQISRRINLFDFLYTLSQSIKKTSQEYVFRKLSLNSGSVQKRSNIGQQNHYYKTIRRFKQLLNSNEDDILDEKNKEIVYRHFIRIFPKNYEKNIYSHKWCNLKERFRDEENLREAFLFSDKGDQNLLRFMEFVAKKEKNLHNLRKFFIARLHKIKTLNNSNIFALANLADRFYKDLNSKYLCQTCYCKDGEVIEKFNNQFYCNCECHLEIREHEMSMKESELESEKESIRESLDMGSFIYNDDIPTSKINYDEEIEENIEKEQSIEIKLNLIKKDKKEKKDSASSLSSYRGDFMARLSKRQSKISKIDLLFKRAEKSMIKTQEELESKKSMLEIDDSSKLSPFGEDSKRSFLEKTSRKILLDISRKTIHSFLSIEEELLNSEKEKDGIMEREHVEINLIKKFDSKIWKKPSNDELSNIKAEVSPRVQNRIITTNDELSNIKVFPRVQNRITTTNDELSNIKVSPRVQNRITISNGKLSNIKAEVSPRVQNRITTMSDELSNIKAEVSPLVQNRITTANDELSNIKVSPRVQNRITTTNDELKRAKSEFFPRQNKIITSNDELNRVKTDIFPKDENKIKAIDELTKIKAQVFPRVDKKIITSNEELNRVKADGFSRNQNKITTIDDITRVKANVFPRGQNQITTIDDLTRVKSEIFPRVQNKSITNSICIRSEDGESKINVIPHYTSNKNKIPTTFSHTKNNLSLLKKSIILQKDKTLILRDENFTNDD